jgi:hypothetical protein
MAEIARFTSSAGIHHVIERDGDGLLTDRAIQPVDEILARNQAMALHNDGYSASRELRRVASIPLSLIYQWREEEGWDAFDPAHADKLAQKLNDPAFSLLRTAEGRVSALPDGGLR